MSRISLICLVLLCCLSLIFSDVLCSRAYAAVSSYDPDDYISEISINLDDSKHVIFDFSSIPSLFDIWEDPSGTKTQLKNVTGTKQWRPSAGCTKLRMRIFNLGVETWETSDAKPYSVVNIGDIMPGVPLDAGFQFSMNVTRVSMSDYQGPAIASLHVNTNFGFYTYDKDGHSLGVKWGPGQDVTYNFAFTGTNVYNPSAQYTFDPAVKYIAPFLSLAFTDDVDLNEWLFEIKVNGFSLSTDIDMIYENSVTMDRIEQHLDDIGQGVQDANDKLDDVNQSIQDNGDKLDDVNQSIQDNGDKLDDVNQSIQEGNDKLDDIYTGGDAGQDLGDAGDQLSGASNSVSDAVGGMADDVGNVSDFESGQFEHIEYAFDQLTIVQDFGQFNASLAFVSGYVEDIFSELEGWQIVITLPLFIGLFFGLCQHVGGISHVRAVHAREARNDELHQARLDKIRGG